VPAARTSALCGVRQCEAGQRGGEQQQQPGDQEAGSEAVDESLVCKQRAEDRDGECATDLAAGVEHGARDARRARPGRSRAAAPWRWACTARGESGTTHPVVGDLELTHEALELPADTGLTIITYTAEPGSAAQNALSFLASWTLERQQPSATEAEHKEV